MASRPQSNPEYRVVPSSPSGEVDSYKPVSLAEGSDDELLPEITSRDDKMAFARTTIGVTMREGGTIKVEATVSGAVIVMPQVARTTGWDKSLSILAWRSWVFLIFNFFVQAALLSYISKECSVMNKFGGQMRLCDFGAFMENCPDGPGCVGPLGTDVDAPRMYDWDNIISRQFTKDSLKAIFPEKAQDINDKIDVGEYGVESYSCRLACCFIFMISCMQELTVIFKLVELIIKIPTEAEPWIQPKKPAAGETFIGHLEEVTIKIAGMPLTWKLINVILVVFPKAMLWKLLTETGITFLMETGAIDDIIINSVGLSFILDLDAMIGTSLMSEETVNMVNATENFELYDETTSCVGDVSLLSDHELLAKHHETQSLRSWSCADTWALFPAKLFATIALTAFFVCEYYWKECQVYKEGDTIRMVSKTMFAPMSLRFTWLNAFLPMMFPLETESEPYWEMEMPDGDK